MGIKIEGFVGTSFMRQEQREAILAEIPEEGSFLELGTGHGVTVAWWAQQRPGVLFTSIDTFQPGKGTGPGDIAHWLENHQPNQRLFVGDACDWDAVTEQRYDIVFIDGNHSRAACAVDLHFLQDHVYEHGKLLVHDYRRDCHTFRGVVQAVDQFCKEWHWRIDKRLISTAVLVRAE